MDNINYPYLKESGNLNRIRVGSDDLIRNVEAYSNVYNFTVLNSYHFTNHTR